MKTFKAQIRSIEFQGWASRFREWCARIVEEGQSDGNVKPGLYLVSVRGFSPQHFYALPVSPSLLEHIRQAAQNPEDDEDLYHITSTEIHDCAENWK